MKKVLEAMQTLSNRFWKPPRAGPASPAPQGREQMALRGLCTFVAHF